MAPDAPGAEEFDAFALLGLSTCWAIVWYPNENEFEHHRARGFRVYAT